MNALALEPGTTKLGLVHRDEPALVASDQIKLQVLEVGICGTDRDEAAGGRARAGDGQRDLVLGHEMLGRVVATGGAVTRVRVGDLAVFTVRRGCGHCAACSADRADMCLTGDYRERGIWGSDGYQAQYVVDHERYVVRVPAELRDVGVLPEPLSVAEKAIDEAARIQAARLPEAIAADSWLAGRRCLVAGLGPIGLLGALILRLRGAEVFGLDVVDDHSLRPLWLRRIGGHYLDGRGVVPVAVADAIGAVDLIVEATGVPALEFELLDALALDGVYVLTGIPAGNRPTQLPAAELVRKLVLGNQLLVGSVNAAHRHYRMAVADLAVAHDRWPGLVPQLITQRYPVAEFAGAFGPHGADEIKVVVEWQPRMGGA